MKTRSSSPASPTHSRRAPGASRRFAGLLEADAVAEARAHLDDDVAERAYKEGLTMTVDHAVALARNRDSEAEPTGS